MPKIEGLQQIYTLLRKKSAHILDAKTKGKPSVTVGFSQNYAIYVHENLEVHHPVGQAKYLEQPAREMGKELGQITAEVIKNGGTVEEGLLVAGLELQRAAQELTPVDTGALKSSAFTCLTSDEDDAAASAYAKGESVRRSAGK